MESAFGVDHGEISKAERLPRVTTARKLGRLVRTGSIRASSRGDKLVNTPLSVSGLGRATGRGTQKVGEATTAFGHKMQANGGVTGGVVVAGGAGAGYAGYKHAQNQPPKKTKPPRAM